MTSAKRIIALADELSKSFERRKRNDGQEYVTLKDGSPEWMTDVCRAAHNDAAMLPDDERYEMIWDAAEAIAEFANGAEDEEDIEPFDVPEFFSTSRDTMADHVSPYTNDRTAWLASRVDRYAYIDEAVEDQYAGNWTEAAKETSGEGGGFIHLIALGMYEERGEVFDQVLNALTEQAEKVDA